MAVVTLSFWDPSDGSLLGTLDDTECETIELRPALFELGAGTFTVSRHLAAAELAMLAKGNLVTVTIPAIAADPFWGFVIDTDLAVLISHDEQGGEDLTVAGPGLMAVLGNARLDEEWFAPSPPASDDRGSSVTPGEWLWRAQAYGAIYTRAIEEGINQPGTPLALVNIDFDRTDDSDSVPWDTMAYDYIVPTGTNVLELGDRLAMTGEFYPIMVPVVVGGDLQLNLSAYQSLGSDLSATVQFRKGVNVLTELNRQTKYTRVTHLITKDSDGTFDRHVTANAYDQASYGFIDLAETNDPTTVGKIAATALDASELNNEEYELEIVPTLLPFRNFNLGDTVNVHTGTGEHDLNETEQRVVAVRIVLDDASVDTSTGTREKSLRIVPELSYRETRGMAGTNPQVRTEGVSHRHPPNPQLCRPNFEADQVGDRLYFTTSSPGVTYDQDPDWDGAPGTDETALLSLTPTGTATGGGHANDAVNLAAGRYHSEQYSIALSDADLRAKVQAGGSFRLQVLANSRHGIGISEPSQLNYLCASMRVMSGASTLRGQMVNLDDVTGTVKFPASSTQENRSLIGSFAAVPSAISTDKLVVELGWYHAGPTSGGTGAAFFPNDDESSDLPADDSTTATNMNSWLDLYSAGQATPADGHPDLVGTGIRASRCDHRHDVHRDRGPGPTDDVEAGYGVGNVWAHLDNLSSPTAIVDTWVLVDATAGAAVWLSTTAAPIAEAIDLHLATATHGSGSGSGLIVPDLLNSEKASADTPDAEFGGTISPFTAVDGSSGTVSLNAGSGAGVYDVATRAGWVLMQVGTASGDSVELKQDYTLPDGNCIVAYVCPAIDNAGTASANNEWAAGIVVNDNDTAGHVGSTAAQTLMIQIDAEASGHMRIMAYDGTSTLGDAPTSNVSLAGVFLRIDRSGLVYRAFFSYDGWAWSYLGSKTMGTAANNVWLFANCAATMATRMVFACPWFRQGTALAIDPWPL